MDKAKQALRANKISTLPLLANTGQVNFALQLLTSTNQRFVRRFVFATTSTSTNIRFVRRFVRRFNAFSVIAASLLLALFLGLASKTCP